MRRCKGQYCKTGNAGCVGRTHLRSRGVPRPLRRERVGNSHLGAGDGQEQQRGGNSHHAAFQRGFTGMTLNFSKGSPRSNLGSLSSVGHCPHRSPKHLRTLSSPHPSLPPSPALPTASAALPAVSHLLQHLWVAAAGAGAGSSRAR